MKKMLAFFGAFNPPTVAHIELAEYANTMTDSGGVVFVPSKSAYIKNEQGKDFAFSDAERLWMLNAISKTHPWMKVSDCEISAETQPRTYNTLCFLRTIGYDTKLLIGSDKLFELESGWLYVDKIAKEFGIVCLERGEDDAKEFIEGNSYLSRFSSYITVVQGGNNMRNVSSTVVRKSIRERDCDTLNKNVPSEILPFLLKMKG